MLYIKRRIGQKIIIDGNIEMNVLEINGNSVTLGFNSERSHSIMRHEVYEKVVKENISSSKINLQIIEQMKSAKEGN